MGINWSTAREQEKGAEHRRDEEQRDTRSNTWGWPACTRAVSLAFSANDKCHREMIRPKVLQKNHLFDIPRPLMRDPNLSNSKEKEARMLKRKQSNPTKLLGVTETYAIRSYPWRRRYSSLKETSSGAEVLLERATMSENVRSLIVCPVFLVSTSPPSNSVELVQIESNESQELWSKISAHNFSRASTESNSIIWTNSSFL